MTPLSGPERRTSLFTFTIFVLGAVFGGIIIPTMTHQGPKIQKVEIQVPQAIHTAASMSQIPVPIITHADFNALAAKVCPQADLPVMKEGDVVLSTEILRCLTVAAQNTEVGRNRSVSPRVVAPRVQTKP